MYYYHVKKGHQVVLLAALMSAVMLPLKGVNAAEGPAFPLPEHVDQQSIVDRSVKDVIRWGSKLFAAEYNKHDGVGSNLSFDPEVSIRFTRYPRMDLPGFSAHPSRISGPNAQSCTSCHGVPYPGAAGDSSDTEVRDPHRSGDPAQYIQRNPLHLFGSGALQLLAEQTTRELKIIRSSAAARAAASGQAATADLITSNNINYGRITVHPSGEVDVSEVAGIDVDLILRPYLWKGGFVTFLRPLVGLGMDLELGMQAVEAVGPFDFDFDGVTNELSVGDVTAATVYVASLPRPVTEIELSQYLGGEYKLSRSEIYSIKRGEKIFDDVGCASCHTPVMKLNDSVFREPSPSPEHRFPILLTGQDPLDVGLDPQRPVSVDLASNPQVGHKKNDSNCRNGSRHKWQPDNCFLQYESVGSGGILVRLYGDLKRHDMGPGLAEAVDDIGTGKTVWKTRELWGTGNTGPWLHDGRATTLDEAILWHGGEAEAVRNNYAGLVQSDKDHLIRFLRNLILYKPGSERKFKY